MHARRMNSASSERPVTTAERKGLRYALIRARSTAWLVMAAVLLSGCTHTSAYIHNGFKVGPNYEMPPAAVALQWIDHNEPRIGTEATDLSAWWTLFHDPALDALIGDAHQQNLDLKIAAAHVLEATAQRNIAIGNLLPQSQKALAAYAHLQLPRSLGLPFTGLSNVWLPGFNASWELDFWGRYRRASRREPPRWKPMSRILTMRSSRSLPTWRRATSIFGSLSGGSSCCGATSRSRRTFCRFPRPASRRE